jgi:hypothetical protein
MIRIVGEMKAKEEYLSAKSDRKKRTKTNRKLKLIDKRNRKEIFCYVLYLCSVNERKDIDRIRNMLSYTV